MYKECLSYCIRISTIPSANLLCISAIWGGVADALTEVGYYR